MVFSGNKFKYIMGIFLFLFVFIIGFVKVNMVYSSTGINSSVKAINGEQFEENSTISTVNDNAFISIYPEDYGYDVVFNIDGQDKVFSIKLPWRTSNSYANK